MKKGKFIVGLLLVFSSIVNAQVDYKDSWVSAGVGGAYKGLIGAELNGGLDICFLKTKGSGLRASIYNELGAGPAGMGIAWMHSHTSLAKLTLIGSNNGMGISYGYGFEKSYFITEKFTDIWGGWKTHRVGVVTDENVEIYININIDNPDDFWKIMTLEIGVIGKLGLF